MHRALTASALVFATASSAVGAPRDVQFRSVNLTAGVLELHNFGDASEDLTGWRFCSHNAAVVRRYSNTGGLNGVTIDPGDSLYIHFNNDATAPDAMNISAIGPFAAFSADAFAIQIYFPPATFANGNQIADIIQWTADGTANLMADERTDEAVTGGVWGAIDDFINVNSGTFIRLMDLTGASLQTSASYVSVPAIVDCNANGRDDALEMIDGEFDPCAANPCPADFDGTGAVGSGDLAILLAAWGACP